MAGIGESASASAVVVLVARSVEVAAKEVHDVVVGGAFLASSHLFFNRIQTLFLFHKTSPEPQEEPRARPGESWERGLWRKQRTCKQTCREVWIGNGIKTCRLNCLALHLSPCLSLGQNFWSAARTRTRATRKSTGDRIIKRLETRRGTKRGTRTRRGT